MGNREDEYLPTRISLLNRLKDLGDNESWSDFFDTYWNLIYGVARKAGANDSEAQDVVQEVIISVARNIEGFEYDASKGTFKAWLLKLTRWRIGDQWRKKHFEKQGKRLPREEPLRTSVLNQQPAPDDLDLDRVWEEEWERNLLRLALAKVKPKVKALQYQMFHLHVRKNLDAKSVAEKLGVKLPEVYYAKYKVERLLKKEIKALEKKMS